MTIQVDDNPTEPTLFFLKRCYRFVNEEWQHADREPLPDRGFEERFRECCTLRLPGWQVSPPRELRLGMGLDTASGTLHEVDVVAQHPNLTSIVELKNRASFPPEKNDVIVFFAKMLDYLAGNACLLLKETCPVFMSCFAFERSGLAACLGLGIHPIAPGLRPLPVLVESARIMAGELRHGIPVTAEINSRFEDLCSKINRVSHMLQDTWIGARCGYLSSDKMVLKATVSIDTLGLSDELRQMNTECTDLIRLFRLTKTGVTA